MWLTRNQPQTDVLVRQGGVIRSNPRRSGFLGKRFMALVKASEFRTRAFVFALVVVGCTATCGSAWAQYWGDNPSGGWGRSGGWGWDNRPSRGWGDRYPSDRFHRQSPYRDFFYPFSSDRRNRPAPAADYSKAPPPRKLEKPTTSTVVVVGDSMAMHWMKNTPTSRKSTSSVKSALPPDSFDTMQRTRHWIGRRQPRRRCRTKNRMPSWSC